jgi:hypothetical protein
MDNVQNCDSYINILLSQTHKSYLQGIYFESTGASHVISNCKPRYSKLSVSDILLSV